MANTPELEVFYQRRTGYLLRRFFWFWPTVTSVEDVERLTLLGFWVSLALAILNLTSIFANYAQADGWGERFFVVAETPLSFAMYYLGANALRRGSFPAAIMLTVLALVQALGFRRMHGYYDYQFTAQALLFLNILRGIYLAARFRPSPGEGQLLNLTAFGGSNTRRWSNVTTVLAMAVSLLIVITLAFEGVRYDSFVIQALLVLNLLRALYFVSTYEPAPTAGAFARTVALLGHGMVDRLPAKLWPRFQIAFWFLSGVQLAISLVGALPDRAIIFLLDTFHL